MDYSIILSIDCDKSCSIQELRPRTKLLVMTEGNEQLGYEEVWPKGKHRKYAGIVGQATFDRLVDHCELTMSTTETGGMLGAPHCGWIGWSPAFMFEGHQDDRDVIMQAYVCPLPNEREQKKFPLTQEGWDKIKEHLLEKYR